MANETGKVFVYSADISDIIKKLQEIEAGTKRAATAINKDFTINSKAAGEGIASIASTTKTVFDKQTGNFKDLTSETAKFSQNVQVADNEYGKFGQTLKTNADGTKSVSSSFRELSEAQARAAGLINPLIGKSSQLGTNFNQVADVNAKFSKELEKIGPASSIVKSGLTSVSGNTQKFSSIVATSNGKLLELNETVTRTPEGLQKVSRSVKDVTEQYKPMNRGTQAVDKNTVSLGENIKRLASRALLTIPIWLALRAAMTGVSKTLSDGLRDIVEYDKQLQRLKKNIQGLPQTIDKNFSKAKQTITEFSIATGVSTEKITRAIQRFATVGFDFEAAMSAGLDATRLSVILFGEAEETANAFSRAMRVMVTNVDDSKKSSEEIAEAMALTSELYETNAFELKELNGGLEKFAGTAKSMNFTVAETITLLAALSTRGLNAERAGRLLRTSTQKLEQNLSKVAKTLGVKVNPEVDRTFDVFVRVTNAIADLRKTTKTIAPEVSEAIAELFGGVRGGEPIRDIIADVDKVNETFKKFAKTRPDIVKFRQDFEKMSDSVFRQVEIMHNLNKETGKAFVTGIVGGKDFLSSLKAINSMLEGLQKRANLTGSTFRNLFLAATTGTIGFGYIKLQDAKKRAAEVAEELSTSINDAIQEKLKDSELRNLIISIGKLKLDKVGQ